MRAHVDWVGFRRLGVAVWDPRVILTHLLLAYLPFALAISRPPLQGSWPFRFSASLLYASVVGVFCCAVNDFFDRGEDLWHKVNPFDHDTHTGFSFIVVLLGGVIGIAGVLAALWGWIILVLTAIGAFLAWWYSDSMVLKRVLGVRLKDHYSLEICGMMLGYSAFLVASLEVNDVEISHSWPIILIVAVDFAGRTVKKDLRDEPKDRRAGNMTVPVVCGGSTARMVYQAAVVLNCAILISLVSANQLPVGALLGLLGLIADIRLKYLPSRLGWVRYVFDIHPGFLLLAIGILLTS